MGMVYLLTMYLLSWWMFFTDSIFMVHKNHNFSPPFGGYFTFSLIFQFPIYLEPGV